LQACTTGIHCRLAPQAAIAGRHGSQARQIGPARRQKGVQETPYTVKSKKEIFAVYRIQTSDLIGSTLPRRHYISHVLSNRIF
jgi:hypothetical protein